MLNKRGGGEVRKIRGWKWFDIIIIGGCNNRGRMEQLKIVAFFVKHVFFHIFNFSIEISAFQEVIKGEFQ